MSIPRILTLLALAAALSGCAELTELRGRTEIQQHEINRLRGELEQWQGSHSDLLTRYEEREADLQERHTARIYELETENTRLRTGQSETERELQVRITQTESSLLSAQTQLATQTTETESLRAQTDELGALLGENQSDRDALLAEIEQINAAIQAHEGETEAAQEGERDARTALTELRDSLQTAVGERDDVIEQMRAQLAELQAAQADAGLFTGAELERIADYLAQTIENADGPTATITQDSSRGVVLLFTGGDLFEESSTVISEPARRTLAALGLAIEQLEETTVQVIGHTDNEPVRNLPFRDNWQLSASRAENVMRVFIEDAQLPPSRCLYGAGGEHHPVESNSTLTGRRANRRVEIIVAPQRDD